MRKNKQISEKNVTFARGGNHKMMGKGGTGPQAAGVSATTHHGPSSKKTFARGGNTKMFGKQKVKALKPA